MDSSAHGRLSRGVSVERPRRYSQPADQMQDQSALYADSMKNLTQLSPRRQSPTPTTRRSNNFIIPSGLFQVATEKPSIEDSRDKRVLYDSCSSTTVGTESTMTTSVSPSSVGSGTVGNVYATGTRGSQGSATSRLSSISTAAPTDCRSKSCSGSSRTSPVVSPNRHQTTHRRSASLHQLVATRPLNQHMPCSNPYGSYPFTGSPLPSAPSLGQDAFLPAPIRAEPMMLSTQPAIGSACDRRPGSARISQCIPNFAPSQPPPSYQDAQLMCSFVWLDLPAHSQSRPSLSRTRSLSRPRGLLRVIDIQSDDSASQSPRVQ